VFYKKFFETPPTDNRLVSRGLSIQGHKTGCCYTKLSDDDVNYDDDDDNNNNNNIFNCKWAVTRWQWLLCMYINMK